MKTKVVRHVPRINLSYLKFKIFKFLKFFLVPSFCLTFRRFLLTEQEIIQYRILNIRYFTSFERPWQTDPGIWWCKASRICFAKFYYFATANKEVDERMSVNEQ